MALARDQISREKLEATDPIVRLEFKLVPFA